MKQTVRSYCGWILLFLAFWIAVSGSLHWQQLLFGVAAAVFVVYFNRHRLIAPGERPPVNFKTLYRFSAYCFRLLVDIARANFQVARLVLHPRMPISPRMVSLEVDLNRYGTRVLFANSITLTPGTLTVLAEGNKYLVHSLTASRTFFTVDAHWDLAARLRQIEEA